MKHLSSGECADIYEIDSNTVLKLSKIGWDKQTLYQEFLNGKLINESGIPAPKVYEFIENEGRYGYTMERLQNLTFLDLMWKHPLKVRKYAKEMAIIHSKIHNTKAPNGLLSLVDKYKEFINEKQGIDQNIKTLIFKDIESLYEKSNHCICHGDFHPINILVSNDKFFVIDWILSTIGPAEADVAGTYLITKLYSSSNKKGNLIKRFISAIGGEIIAKTYLKEYISLTGIDKSKIMQWIPIRAATYIDVGLPTHLENKLKKIIENKYHI